MRIVLIILWTLFWVFLGYLVFMPALSLSFGSGIYWYMIIYSAVLYLLSAFKKDQFGDTLLNVKARSLLLIPCLGILAIICIGIYSWGWFHTETYRNMIGKVEEQDFVASIAPIDPAQMITVDQEIAQRIGGIVLGEDPGLGSRCKLGEFHLQQVDKKLYWIAPLLHSGFWKWQGNDSTPGYVVVNATNERDYRLIKEVNGKPINIRYQPNAYFGQDLERHIYTSGYQSQGFADYTFEVDESWNPYWTVSLYDSKIGFFGDDVTRLIIVNPQTGEINGYSLDQTPAWCDRVHPESFVVEQLKDWGEFIHGYWNWSGKDKLRPADERSIVAGADGQMYYYIGLQSKGADQSTVGFMLVNCRTKKSTWIRQAGATETAARASAEGMVQEKGYVGSEGITYNMGGYPTYEFLLKDKSGLMKLIALVNVHDHNVVGFGPDRLTAIHSYLNKMSSRGNAVVGQPREMVEVTKKTKISRFNNEVANGTTTYFFMIDGVKKQFFGTSSISSEFCLTLPGDSVTITYLDSEQSEIEVNNFDNLKIGALKNVTQLLKEGAVNVILDEQLKKAQNGVTDAEWKKLSPSEKQKLLKKN